MGTALGEMIPKLPLKRTGGFTGPAQRAGNLAHLRLPVPAFIGLLLPVGEEGLFVAI